MRALLDVILIALQIYIWLLIASAILSWLIAFNVISIHNSDTVRQVWFALQKITEPFYRPIRRILPDFGALDLSPLVVLLILYILSNIIVPAIAAQLFIAPVI